MNRFYIYAQRWMPDAKIQCSDWGYNFAFFNVCIRNGLMTNLLEYHRRNTYSGRVHEGCHSWDSGKHQCQLHSALQP